MVKLNANMEAGTDAATITDVQVNYVSQTIAKPLVVRRHPLKYDMYSCKVSWCPICNNHFYNDRNKEHTTIETSEHYHEL